MWGEKKRKKKKKSLNYILKDSNEGGGKEEGEKRGKGEGEKSSPLTEGEGKKGKEEKG